MLVLSQIPPHPGDAFALQVVRAAHHGGLRERRVDITEGELDGLADVVDALVAGQHIAERYPRGGFQRLLLSRR